MQGMFSMAQILVSGWPDAMSLQIRSVFSLEYKVGRPVLQGFGGFTSDLLAVPECLFLGFGTVRFMFCFLGIMVVISFRLIDYLPFLASFSGLPFFCPLLLHHKPPDRVFDSFFPGHFAPLVIGSNLEYSP